MGYEVLVEHLHEAAGKLRTITDPLEGYELASTHSKAEDFGHVELAAWFAAVVEQCDAAGQALRDGAETLATSLDTTARDYQLTDEGVASSFRSPFTTPGYPFAPAPPFAGPTP